MVVPGTADASARQKKLHVMAKIVKQLPYHSSVHQKKSKPLDFREVRYA
jgi:hypothetical protein